jgi:hypothetical protein
MSEPAYLHAYRFDPDAVFEGGLVGAIERLGIQKDYKLLDGLFVRRDPAGDGLEAIDMGAAGTTFASLLDFRLDPARRRTLTERTLTEHRHGVPRQLIDDLAATLTPGAAILALLHLGSTLTTLDDAATRCGGRAIIDEPVDARELADVGARLREAATAT